MRNQASRRAFLKMMALTTAGAALAACVPAAPTASTQESAAAGSNTEGKTQIRFHARIGTQGDYYTEMAKTFNESQDQIEVIAENFPGGGSDYTQKIATMIAGGTIGDGMWTASINGFYNYAAAGQYAILDDFVAADNYDLSVYYPVAVDSCRYEGKMYGIPWIVHPGRIGLYYNQTAFEEAGMDVPNADWTYDDLMNAATAMTKKEGDQTTQWGFLPTTDYFGLVIALRSFGSDWLNAEGTELTFDDEAGLAGLRMWEKFYTEGVAPTPAQVDDQGQMWASGRIIMTQTGYWGQSWGKNFVKDFEWMVAPMPKGAAGSRSMFEFDPNVVLQSSKAPAAVWEFLKYVSTKEAGIKIAQMGSVPGGRPDVWEDPALADYPPHAVFAEIMKTIDPLVLPANFRSEELLQVVQNVLAPVWLGDSTIDEVAPTLRESMQGILDQPAL